MTQLSVMEQLIKHRLPDRTITPTPPVQSTVAPAGDTEAITDLQAFLRSQATLVGTFDTSQTVVSAAEPQQIVADAAPTPVPSVLDQLRSQQAPVQPTMDARVEPPTAPRPAPTYVRSGLFSYSDIAPPVQDRVLQENGQVEPVPVAPVEAPVSEREVVREVSRRSLFGGQLVL